MSICFIGKSLFADRAADPRVRPIGLLLRGLLLWKAVGAAHSEIAPNGVPLLPVQLIEAALVFGLFFLLWQMSRRGMDGRRMLGWYLLVYSVGRFVLEFFRGDTYRGFIGILSVSQVIALLSILGGGLLLWRTRAPRNA